MPKTYKEFIKSFSEIREAENDIIKRVEVKIRKHEYVLSNSEWKELLSALEKAGSRVQDEILGKLSGEGSPANKKAEMIAMDAKEDFLAYTKEGRPIVRTMRGYGGKPDHYEIV